MTRQALNEPQCAQRVGLFQFKRGARQARDSVMPIRSRRADAHGEPGAHGDLRERIQAEQFDAALEQGIQARLGEFEHLRCLDLAQVLATHAGRDAARELAFERDQGRGGHG